MKVSTFNSVGAKLFYYMTALVLITVAGNSFQYIRSFMEHQTQQVQDSIQLNAERAGSQVENVLETWRSQIAVALPGLRGQTSDDTHELIRKFVDASPEFVALQLFEAPTAKSMALTPLGDAFTSNTNEARFEDKIPSKVWDKVRAAQQRWMKLAGPRIGKNNIMIESFAKSSELPLMAVAVRFDVAESQSVVWAVLTAWQSNLIKSLPKSKFVDSALVDSKGKIFTSPNLFDMVNRHRFAGEPLVRTALGESNPSGFENEYRHANGNRRLGAYFKLPRYDLTLLVEQDAEAAYLALKKNLLSTALWAGLFVLIAIMFSFLGATGITRGLREVTMATGRIAAGDLLYQIKPRSKDEVGVLAHSVNHMAGKITGLMQSQVDKARFEKELETAKMVQSTFFPKSDINRPELHLTGFYQPASECGGDLWGHYTIDEGIEFVFIADAMGLGAPAALVTAIAYSTTMAVADIVRDRSDFQDSPAKILERLNRIIFEAVQGKISMTFFAAIFDFKQGLVTYANAGHNFPVIIPANPEDPRAAKQRPTSKKSDARPISLKLAGNPLGIAETASFKEQTLALAPGDKFFFFTDGLIECTAPNGEAWGRKHLLEHVAETSSLIPTEMKDQLLGRAFGFFANHPLDDDVTVVVAEINKAWQGPAQANVPAGLPAIPAAFAVPAAEGSPIDTLPTSALASAPASRQEQSAPPIPVPVTLDAHAPVATPDVVLMEVELDAPLEDITFRLASGSDERSYSAPGEHQVQDPQSERAPAPPKLGQQPKMQPQPAPAPAPTRPTTTVSGSGKYKLKLRGS